MNICPYLIIQMYKIIFKRDEWIWILIWLHIVPIKKVLKLVINSILGGVTIFLINLIGGIWGFHIGLNIFTSILVGLLGVPGVICLIVVKLLI